MYGRWIAAPVALALGVALFGASLVGASAEPDFGLPFKTPVPRPSPGARAFGPNGPDLGLIPGIRGRSTGEDQSAPKRDEDHVQVKVPTRAQLLDGLFDRLAKSTDPDEAGGIAALIERTWMRSGSDTADLLMSRAVAAMGTDHRDVATALLDKIVALRPDWAEGWNKRATLRFLEDDDAGSMEDLSHVLALEPRHFGALSGMGFILKRNGLDAGALKALRKALALYPENPDLRKAVDQLTPEVEGRDL